MSDKREYDCYCKYRNTKVVKSEYNQSGTFIHFNNGWYEVRSSLVPCRCVECQKTNCDECDWPDHLAQEFKLGLALWRSATHRCTQCMGQYKQKGILR